MKFRDLFVPAWQRSSPEVRIKAIGKLEDTYILKHIIKSDEDQLVRNAARDQLDLYSDQVQMSDEKIQVSEKE